MRFFWPPRNGCTSSRQSLDPKNGSGQAAAKNQTRLNAETRRNAEVDFLLGNGPITGLKTRCPKGRAGSTPALGTTLNHFCYNNLHVTDDWLVLTTLREM